MQSNVSALAIAAALAILGAQAQAQGTYPSRPVRLIVPLAAGGGMDTVARALSLKLTDQAGQTIIVDNRGGGGGSIGAAYPDLIAGNIQLTFASIISGLPHIRAQRIRALAVTGSKRAKAAPELPTVAEVGVKGFSVSQWYGVFAPAKTPRAIVDKVH